MLFPTPPPPTPPPPNTDVPWRRSRGSCEGKSCEHCSSPRWTVTFPRRRQVVPAAAPLDTGRGCIHAEHHHPVWGRSRVTATCAQKWGKCHQAILLFFFLTISYVRWRLKSLKEVCVYVCVCMCVCVCVCVCICVHACMYACVCACLWCCLSNFLCCLCTVF